MATEIRIPSFGVGMTHATLTEWLVEDGDEVKEGQNIYSLEMEKSVADVPSPADGKLEIRGNVATEYMVGEVIAILR